MDPFSSTIFSIGLHGIQQATDFSFAYLHSQVHLQLQHIAMRTHVIPCMGCSLLAAAPPDLPRTACSTAVGGMSIALRQLHLDAEKCLAGMAHACSGCRLNRFRHKLSGSNSTEFQGIVGSSCHPPAVVTRHASKAEVACGFTGMKAMLCTHFSLPAASRNSLHSILCCKLEHTCKTACPWQTWWLSMVRWASYVPAGRSCDVSYWS